MEVNQLVSDVIHFLANDTNNNWKELKSLIHLGNEVNPYTKHPESYMWEEQCGINIPLLYVSSIYLYTYAKKHGVDTYLFATRDCCQWIKIFKKLYPEEHAVYFNCSRNMLDGATTTKNAYYDTYVKSCIKTSPDKCVFVDLHGTGKRIFSYFEKAFGNSDECIPYTFLLSSSYRRYSEFPSVTQKYYAKDKFINLIFDARGSPIEMLNYDIQGTLQQYTRKGTVRDPVEYDLLYLETYHVCVDYICKKISTVKADAEWDLDAIYKIIQKVYRVIQDNQPAVAHYIKHPSKHPKADH
jgi:hypothetical protein